MIFPVFFPVTRRQAPETGSHWTASPASAIESFGTIGGRGVIGVAILQSLLAGIGLMFAGVPAPGFLTLLVLPLGIVQIGPSIKLVHDGHDHGSAFFGLHDRGKFS